ncbi:alkaline phosphatase [Rossellomorea vietnamensis]|uniref:Alkaline phosphatase n=1 Tax=Rossellomorea vietnamensis TaxID=218284 RepID=A0A5D4NU69_9BACI|nr:alkaline phosphatase [Rossellomorea vietnamensis]TYS17855.1 alkaline phosphatase [Rossellomorea vietnamensis]
MKKYKLAIIPILIFSIIFIAIPPSCLFAETPEKKVIFMVMDGTNSDVVTLARWYKGSPLHLDSILTGGVRTYSAQSAITDSAAGGTAMATGFKTNADYIGMIPDGESSKPAVNLLEAARIKGYGTGIVSTSPVQHATPAAFSAHVKNRDEFSDIAEQQVYQGMDVVLGGGLAWLHSGEDKRRANDDGMLKTKESARKDKENLLEIIEEKDYQILETKADLDERSSGRLWGSFADEDMAYDFDRAALLPEQPSLGEMTSTAIERLDRSGNGFFLFVEGSKIDWAAHKNDPVGMISEVLAFDEAVGEAVEFAKRDGHTMVIAVTDHGNSGLTIGNGSTDKDYFDQPVKQIIEPLKKARLTVKGASSQLEKDRSNLKEVLASYGLEDHTEDEFCRVEKAGSVTEQESEMAAMLSKRASLGFTTHGHTGEDVFLYAYGPEKPVGLHENSDLATSISDFLGLDLAGLSDWYVDAREYYEARGYETKIDMSDSHNPKFVARNEQEELVFPENKNIMIRNGYEVELQAVNVYNGETFFVHVE